MTTPEDLDARNLRDLAKQLRKLNKRPPGKRLNSGKWPTRLEEIADRIERDSGDLTLLRLAPPEQWEVGRDA